MLIKKGMALPEKLDLEESGAMASFPGKGYKNLP